MKLLDWIFPPRCLACRQAISSDQELCSACENNWPLLKSPFCTVCAFPFQSSESDSHTCGNCLANPKSFHRVHAAGLYEGVLHDLLLRFKYQKEERLGQFLGYKMAEVISANYDLILPIPLHKKRLRSRGFNQSALLAREISKILKIPVDPFLLKKEKSTLPQAELRGEERRKNLTNVFSLKFSDRIPDLIKDKKILLVDDVYTTGTTIGSATSILLKHGASHVDVLVLARAT